MRFIGNKTQLLDNIKEVVDKHALEAHSFCDIFSGTMLEKLSPGLKFRKQ